MAWNLMLSRGCVSEAESGVGRRGCGEVARPSIYQTKYGDGAIYLLCEWQSPQ